MIWKPDTCTCILEFSKNTNLKADFVRFTQRCKIHQSATYDDVVLHNQTFNLKYGRNPTESQSEEIKNDKEIEIERIKKL